MSAAFQELRIALRGLVKSPVLSGVAILTLGVGIGMTALMFSFVYGAIYRGLPFPEEERIIRIAWIQPTAPAGWSALPVRDYAQLKVQQTSLSNLAGVYTGTVNVAGNGRPVRYDGAFMTPNGFTSLQVRPVLGRAFHEDEGLPGAPLSIIIGYHVWVNDFGGDSNVLGRTLRVNGEPARVVGIMPPGFKFPEHQDVWVPYRVNLLEVPKGEGQETDRGRPPRARRQQGTGCRRACRHRPASCRGTS